MSDMDHISKELIDLLNCLQKAESADSQTDALALITDSYNPWVKAGMPLLTPRAKDVLAVVEIALDQCTKCDHSDTCTVETVWGPIPCNLLPIRKAYKEKP